MKPKVLLALLLVALLSFGLMSTIVPVLADEDDIGGDPGPTTPGTEPHVAGEEQGASWIRWHHIDAGDPGSDGMCSYLFWPNIIQYTHLFTPTYTLNCVEEILSVTLTIHAWDVDAGAANPEIDEVWCDGYYQGNLIGANNMESDSVFSIDPQLLYDGELDVQVVIDTGTNWMWAVHIYWSELEIIWDYKPVWLVLDSDPTGLVPTPLASFYDHPTMNWITVGPPGGLFAGGFAQLGVGIDLIAPLTATYTTPGGRVIDYTFYYWWLKPNDGPWYRDGNAHTTLFITTCHDAIAYAIAVYVQGPIDPIGDVNWDSHVDIRDLSLISSVFGMTPRDSTFRANCDLNADGIVDIIDLAAAAKNFGYWAI